MRRDLDLEKIARSLESRGYSTFEIYAEESIRTTAQYFDRSERVEYFLEGGVAITALKRDVVHHFQTSDLSTAGAIASLEQKAAERPSEASPPPAATRKSKRFSEVAEFYRTLPQKTEPPLLHFEDEERSFQVYSSAEKVPRIGSDERASVTLQWKKNPASRLPARSQWHRRSIEALLTDLKTRAGLKEAYLSCLKPPVRWPIPHGEVPTVWSPQCIGTLMLPLIRMCEGDQRALRENFLKGTERLPEWLSIRDGGAGDPEGQIDFQGVPRKPLSLIERGRLSEIACDKSRAFECNAEPTGHARRESFSKPIGVGLWDVTLGGSIQLPPEKSTLLEEMGNGLYIQDLDLVGFHPRDAMARLLIKEGRLVHHGELGEYLEPYEMEISLLQLLGQTVALGPLSETLGFQIKKQSGRHITEVTAPAALTAAVPYHGQVPVSHYW